MKCRDCKFQSEPKVFTEGGNPQVRCTLGSTDWRRGTPDRVYNAEGWYSYGQSQLNLGPVKRIGATCTRGEPK
ncbi:hypothetical protein LCGC14_0481150 [marine sediment metagenome]|uniref:Uncharacterized protein n=1 Tax=marine sediment metagenome TaxID=412755 RepID=A0A0F9UWE4_9ZZZZ